MSEFLTRAEAADYLTKRGLKITKSTLQKMATVDGGPLYRLFGNKAIYEPSHLDEWASQKIGPARHSTSESNRAVDSIHRGIRP